MLRRRSFAAPIWWLLGIALLGRRIIRHAEAAAASSPFFSGSSRDTTFSRHTFFSTATASPQRDDDDDDEPLSTTSATGRARVVVDTISDDTDFLLQLEGRHDAGHREPAPFSRGRRERTSASDLQLVWSEPTTANNAECHDPNWYSRFTRDSAESLNTKSLGKQNNNKPYDPSDRFTSTGTTIVGVAGPAYCILAADSRATAGTMVADKRCHKLHALAVNCAAAGAGTSADLDHLTRECCYAARLMQQNTWHGNDERTVETGGSSLATTTTTSDSPISVHQLCRYLLNRLYRQGGSCQAYLIVGGVYNGESVLRAIHPHGSMDVVSYTALGSGGLAAMGVLESRFSNYNSSMAQHNMTMDEAVALALEAVKAGIDHDMGSGSQVDLCVIGPDGAANFTRCVVPEDALHPLSVEDGKTVTTAAKAGTPVVEAHGVNGFGNLPYAIRSKRVIQESREQQERNLQEQWDDILGE